MDKDKILTTAAVITRVVLPDDDEAYTESHIDNTTVGVLIYHADSGVVIVDGREFSRAGFRAALLALADTF